MLYIFSILISIFFSINAYAQENPVVTEILSPDTVTLSDGRTVAIGGVITRPEAQDYLEKNLKGKMIDLIPDDALINRYSEVVAHIKTSDGIWIQKDLIKNDLARAYTSPSFRDEQVELIAAEPKNSDYWRVLDSQSIDPKTRGFHIIEGWVVDAVERGKYVYLNFGTDYKTDFTISMTKKSYKDILKEGVDVLELKGKNIRVRGWVDHYNGPFVSLTYKEQLQIMQ